MGDSFDSPHIPVMLDEVLQALSPQAGQVYVDGTMGAGGYTRAILDSAACRVIAIDRDPETHRRADDWAEPYQNHLTLVHDAFGNAGTAVAEKVDGFVLDLGVSSMQLDQAERGFSFRFEGPLDMRMDTSCGQSAADLVNGADESDLADIIYTYGDERHSRRVAKAIVAGHPVTTTGQLASIIRSVLPRGKDAIDPATRTFQALRIAVNDELGELQRALEAAEKILASGGRLVIVTFHSLEDRIVKNFLKERSGDLPSPSRHLPAAQTAQAATFTLLTRKAVEAGADEIKRNPRARSAKLRAAIRTDAPAWKGAA